MLRKVLIWVAVCAALVVPVAAAGLSPLLQWRQPVYIVAGFAGIAGFALMFLQPLLAGGYLPGIDALKGRRVHRRVGAGIVALVVLHVAGLWLTSPPDVVDALLLRSPTPFSVWGVLVMWLIFATAALAVLRKRLGVRPMTWRRAHTALAVLIVAGTGLHAVLIQGTMEMVSKFGLFALALGATIKVIWDLRIWARRAR
ncbi:ferric reductase-like transmembrane domain-containing protein [Roseovarius atlanticus]|uniref:ferric reductase-like transmembrane domain-containing protein n=1 Tax=Roseovarius atlanticus TaxID=1641875 RepID=UPI001C9373B0|nr:ferric reductase-like transmembrane domain-containing protein [Roseovarius atlanticus]MBY5989416.1 ferric reductase-like transmembrane domain-containing protein [Roseovarius atlanticus]MBY6124808.1 ferric reductase-like transmembrane domain-containing protein [Roseovarius atlanticus]MBY6149303.1 ferric reductase-like transmembrane domain-containing protein [Roseovarius atlanticus]